VQIIYLFIKYSDKKEKTKNTSVNAKHPLRTPEGHFTLISPAIAAKVESLVMDTVMDVLIHFSVITQRSKGRTTFMELLV